MDKTMTETIRPLLGRRSVVAKNLIEPGPDDRELALILATGIRVPDHGKIGPWRLQVLKKPVQAMFGDQLSRIFQARHPDATIEQIAFERRRPQRAPILIVASSRIVRGHKVPEIEQLLSCGAVCQNLLNAATLLGYAGQWLTEWPAYDDQVKSILGVPADQHIIGFISIGTPSEPPNERMRPDVEMVVSFPDKLPVG